MNNIWLVRDLIDYSNEVREPGILVSLDFEKAFDRVNHDFLFRTLDKFGFGPNFSNWIKTINSNSQSYIQNNGHLSLPVQLKMEWDRGAPSLAFYLHS